MSSNTELVFVPTPRMGHLLSMVQIARIIVERYQHISITIYIIQASNPNNISEFVDSQLRNNPYPTRLTYVALPPLSNPPTPSLISSPIVTAVEWYKPLIKQAVEDRTRSGFPKPVGFVLDIFCTGVIDVANELNVNSYVFFTSGANTLNLVFLIHSMAHDYGIDVASKFNEPGFLLDLPGFKNPVPTEYIPKVFKDKESQIMFRNIATYSKQAKGILMNTYVELEESTIHALLDNSHKDVPPIYHVGPILELAGSSGGSHDEEHESIMKWLDGQPKSSVVFLCFGSMGSFDEDQVKEMANGLEQSGHRFLWALRKPGKSGPSENETYLEALPEGFLKRTAGKGKIIGWAPQVDVLAHPSVGGFVTHCGWNSTLESIWFGVPMATWPLYAEQQLNAFSLVNELGLAVETKKHDHKGNSEAIEGNLLVSAKEIENGVKKLMRMDGGIRSRVKEMSYKGKKALKHGGSSYDSLDSFIGNLLSNV